MRQKYKGCHQVVPGVFVSVGDAVYIADEQGEIVTWNADEVAEDGEAFTAAINAVALAAAEGPGAVRDNLATDGDRLLSLLDKTADGLSEKYASLAWSPGDVQTLRPRWSLTRCRRWLIMHEKHIRDRLVELGWDVLSNLL